uniref:Integrase catalytic domain-containing protein n=1 Tax=Fagus sylvatica TaxID=28930 RepID=A0A2N9IPM6_FAGSY
MLKQNLKATAMPWEKHTLRVVDRRMGEKTPSVGDKLMVANKFLGGGEIPVGGPQQMALMFEMIKAMQQNQAELAESLKQLREVNTNKEDHQNKNDNRNHEERESHNKNDTPFVTMSDVADLLKQERERAPKEPRHFGVPWNTSANFLDSMGPFAANGDLCLREFSKSLVDRAYTWYTVLPAGSIRTWEDMVESFCSKYFHVEEKITLVNLHSTKQQIGEDLVKYIHRFRDVSLDCHVKYQEGELVESSLKFEKSRDKKSLPQTLTVSTATAPSGTKRKNTTDKVYEEPPPLPFTAEEMMAIFDKWVQDQVIKLPKISKQPTPEEQKDPKYCRYHRYVNHSTVDCRTLRWEVNRKIQNGTLLLSEAQQKVHQTPFPNYNKDKGKAVVSVVIHGNVSDVEAEESAAASSSLDMEVQYPDHRRPLYLSAVIKNVQVRRALVDTGSCLNLIPLSTLQAVDLPHQKIQGSPMEVTGFGDLGCTSTNWCHPPTINVSKGRLNGKPIRIAANSCPFDQTEAHFVEAALYDDLASTGEPSIVRPCGTPLPAWEDIKDDPEIDLRELLQRKKKRKEREVEQGSAPQCGPTPEEGGLQPSCHLIQQTENSGKVVVDQLQSTTMNSEEITVDHARSMVMNPQVVAVDQTRSIAANTEKAAKDQAESTTTNPEGSTVDHSQSTVMNSEEEDAVDQTESTARRMKESTTAEPNLTSKEELEVIDLSDNPDITKPVSISKSLSAKERKCLIDLLHEYKDVFAWDYHEMPGIDPGPSGSFFECGARYQTCGAAHENLPYGSRGTNHTRSEKATCCWFYQTHSASTVAVKHCAGQEKERADQMLYSAAGHAMFSFMDGFSGYNQIRMSTRDAEKTAFRTPIGNFYYTVMPFGLKNAGATYQRTMTAMFHDMMHKEIEDYVDDIVVKSKKREDHLGILRKPRHPPLATMKAPTSHKELKSFLGRLSYIRRFIPGLAAVTAVFAPLMKKGSLADHCVYTWLPIVKQLGAWWLKKMKKEPKGQSTMLAEHFKDAETRYSGAERACLALIYASQRLRHYFLAHKIQLITKSHPIRSLLHRPVLSGRLAQWLLQLSQYEITTETPTAIKSQAIADLLAQFPGEDSSSISHEVPGEIGEALLADLADSTWTLKFDGSSTSSSSGAGIVLAREDGKTIAKSFKLDFPCSNNASEYEAYITGLVIAHEMGIKHLRVIGDSNLIICQTKGEFSLKEPSLALYRALAQKLEEEFDTFEISHAMRCENRYADALATLGSQVSFEGSKVDVTIDKRSMPITDLLREKFKEPNLDAEDWRTPIKAKLVAPEGVADLKVLKDYVLIAGDLYRRLPGGVLARCVNLQEAAKKLTEVHEKCCELRDGISLYRRLQRLGYFWPSMSKEAASLQEQCSFCQHQHESDQIYATFVSSDWRTPFLEYLIENILPQTSQAAVRIKKLATRYFVEGGILFRKGFHGDPLRCLSLAESQTVMKEAHSGECGEASRQEKINMATPWPFHTWGLDLIGPINPASGGYIWILVATEYFSKWVEAIPLRKATGAAVANFIREHIITRFGIPHKIISDNGTPFVNKNVREVLEHYRIKHRRSTPYYPQGNGQAEATNRMLLRILSKMVFDYGKGWSSHLADTLWAYRGSTKTATGFTPFSLVYGTDAISPTELLVPSPRILHGMDLEADADICAEARVADLEGLEEARELAQARSLRYHQKLADAYEKTLQTRIFAKGQMVLKTVDHVRRGLPSPSKFAPNWEGPYLIREAYDSGYYKLSTADGTTLADPINGKWLKRYYS